MVVRKYDKQEQPDRKAQIVREVLEALQEWFEVTESREAYIRESREQMAVMGVKKDYHRHGVGKVGSFTVDE